MSRDPASGTAIQEINFWLSMERALEKIDEQLKSDQISKSKKMAYVLWAGMNHSIF